MAEGLVFLFRVSYSTMQYSKEKNTTQSKKGHRETGALRHLISQSLGFEDTGEDARSATYPVQRLLKPFRAWEGVHSCQAVYQQRPRSEQGRRGV